MSIIVILLLPLVATALVCLPFERHWAAGVTVVSCLTILILATRAAWLVSTGNSVTAVVKVGMLKWIAVDGLSALILVLIALVGCTAAIFSVGYMVHQNLAERKLLLYYANYNLFIFSMLAIPIMAEPTLVWIVVELTTLCSALLVSFENTSEALEAAWKYMVLSLMGAAMALFGFLVLFAAMQAAGGGVYTWQGLVAAAPSMPPVLLQTAFLMILIGLGTKAGLVPMHTWLPEPAGARCHFAATGLTCEVSCDRTALPELCGRLFLAWEFSFAGLMVEESASEWQLRYCFYGDGEAGWVHVLVTASLEERIFPSIVKFVHAADWHEREAEDLFGLIFEGHPRLGDFVLHDDTWQENVEPMRRHFDPQAAMHHRGSDPDWRPRRIVEEPGAFVMPIGPKYSGVTESALFLLETVGEDVIRSVPRLFYKWRAIEKLAEGKTADQVLLLAERFAATTAFAHGLAFCLAVEFICDAKVPTRARHLRVFLAELERLRQHAGAIQEICESTALVVANSQAGILEEDLLRISGELTGHRYLFGLLALGGLRCDLSNDACLKALGRSQQALKHLNELEQRLRTSSSFLDRLEEVGFIALRDANVFGLLGPVARASGLVRDLRRAQPYLGYENFAFEVPSEQEGDGYARLRLLFAEARQSVRIMEQAVAALQSGDIREPLQLRAGAALGWVEAPRGGAFHWVRLTDDESVARYRIVPPSFANWHGFHLSVEKFAFQDFPIILSTFDLSVAENDR